MKILFNHTDPATLEASSHLLLELGAYGLSCLWFNTRPNTVTGVRMYHFNEHASGEEVAAHLNQLLAEPEFKQKQVFVFLNQKESLIIPSAHFSHAHLKEMMDLVFGKMEGTLLTDTIHQAKVLGDHLSYNAYRVHPEVLSVLNSAFPDAKVQHSTSVQLQQTQGSTSLYCIVYHHVLKLLLFDGVRLRLVQQFAYKTPADAAYVLLNTCHQHGLIPGDTSLHLSGIIDKDSNLYREIIKYFLEVEFEPVQENVAMENGLSQVSPHYFSHLTFLLSCVS